MYDKTGKSSSVHNICKFMSLKNNRAVRTLSILEFDFCYHLEYNPDIISYRSQPYGFYYQFNGRQCRYTPDFSAKGANNESVFFEVKPSSKIWEPDFRARFAVKQKVAQESLGKKLILITEKTIRLNPILNNLKLLHRYAGLHTTTQAELLVLKFIQKYKLVQLKDVSQLLQIPEHETLISALCWLSAGKLKTDLKSDFCLDSFVWI